MTSSKISNELERKAPLRDLLLADYRYFAEAFLKNEQIGETRVNWFIGIVTGSIGGLIALVTKGEMGRLTLYLLLLSGLFALLAFGVVTLFRILKRNEATDGYKKDLDELRQLYSDQFDSENAVVHYHPFGPPPSPDETADTNNTNATNSPVDNTTRKFGGLAHTVAVLNSLLTAAFGAVVAHAIFLDRGGSQLLPTLVMPALTAVALAGGSFLVQWDLIAAREEESKVNLRRGRVTHAGGVVFSRDTGTVKYLVVQAKEPPHEWVLSKGKVKKRENHQETAMREVREETGVIARVVRYLDLVEYKAGEERVKVKFYLMEKVEQGTASEERHPRWVPFDQAVKVLEHTEAKYLVKLGEGLRGR